MGRNIERDAPYLIHLSLGLLEAPVAGHGTRTIRTGGRPGESQFQNESSCKIHSALVSPPCKLVSILPQRTQKPSTVCEGGPTPLAVCTVLTGQTPNDIIAFSPIHERQ